MGAGSGEWGFRLDPQASRGEKDPHTYKPIASACSKQSNETYRKRWRPLEGCLRTSTPSRGGTWTSSGCCPLKFPIWYLTCWTAVHSELLQGFLKRGEWDRCMNEDEGYRASRSSTEHDVPVSNVLRAMFRRLSWTNGMEALWRKFRFNIADTYASLAT